MRFAFGKNWESYSALIGDRQIAEATACLEKLFPNGDLAGKSFLDIGCGSGLHSLAASKLGVGSITAVDLDPDSVRTTQRVLDQNLVPSEVRELSVFDMTGAYDVVYSWGVLHHTGDLWGAMRKAASLVKPGGLFAFALYRRTQFDRFWIAEKRWYASASPGGQAVARFFYRMAYRVSCAARGESFRKLKADYAELRGMDFEHNIHDWLGGYPYETTLAPEVDAFMKAEGFTAERVFALPMGRGILGSGCDEYVYRLGSPRLHTTPLSV